MMAVRPRPLRIAVVLLTVPLVASCAPTPGEPVTDPNSTSSHAQPDAESVSRAEGEYLDRTFPDIARSMGADSVTHLREITCMGDTASGPTAASKTSWMARAEVVVEDESTARAVAEHVRDQAEKQGWTTSQDPAAVGDQGNFAGTRLLSAKLEDPDLVMTVLYHEDTQGTLTVANQVRGICRDTPDGHEMVHSPLDPDYGTNIGGGYVNLGEGVYTGQARPLPASTQTPPPSGPDGARPVGEIGR